MVAFHIIASAMVIASVPRQPTAGHSARTACLKTHAGVSGCHSSVVLVSHHRLLSPASSQGGGRPNFLLRLEMILVAAPPRPHHDHHKQTVACMGRSVSPSFLVNWALWPEQMYQILYETINKWRSSSEEYIQPRILDVVTARGSTTFFDLVRHSEADVFLPTKSER
jgi:hypothetical protein